jgi:HEAT repeat protein
MSRLRIFCGVLVCLQLVGCAPAVRTASRRPAPKQGPTGTFTVGRVYLEAPAALVLLGRRSSARYVVTARDLPGLVGPFTVDQKISPASLLRAIASATGNQLSWQGAVAVIHPALAGGGQQALTDALARLKSKVVSERRYAAYKLGESLRPEVIPHLLGALGEQDPTVRRAVTMALDQFEGDFEHNEWPGRISVFELASVKLDTDTLMYIVEEAAAPGTAEWRAAVSILGRAREGQLARSIWWNAWMKRQGTMMPTIWAMGRSADPDMRVCLEKRIRKTFTNNATDRFTTAEALARAGLVRSLRKHTSKRQKLLVRAAAVYGLGRCGPGAEVVDTLKAMLKDPSGQVRELAVAALIQTGSPRGRELVAKLLLDSSTGIGMRVAAVAALLESPDQELAGSLSYAKLLNTVLQDKDPRIRAAMAEVLGTRGGSQVVFPLDKLIRDKDRWVRAAAVRALASLGCDYGLLAKQNDSQLDIEVRTANVIGMGQSRDPGFAPILGKIALTPGEDWRLRKYAARSLAMLANRSGQPALKKLLELKNGAITDIPLRYLDLGAADVTTSYLIPWLTRGRGRHEQSLAAERIAEIGTPEGLAALAAGFNAFDNYTRCTQVFSLQFSLNARVRAALLELLKSRRSGVRVSAALGLSGSGAPRCVDALIAALSDKSPAVRMAAANSLGNCGDPAAAGALIKMMLGDKDARVVHQALRALRQNGYRGLKKVKLAFENLAGRAGDCGIPGGETLLAQKGNSWVLRKYYHEYDDETLPNLTYESTVAYVPGTKSLVQWGAHGRRADAPQTGMTWEFRPRTNTWIRPIPRQEPPGTCLNRDIVTDANRSMVVSPKSGMGGHGWVMNLRKYASKSVPWVYDAKKHQWYPMRAAKNPGSHGMVAAVYDRRQDVVIVHGGRERVYDVHRNEWTTMHPPAPRPGEKSEQPGAYDPVTARFIMVADKDAKGRGRTWAYDLAANRWTELKPSNPPPHGRVPMVYDSANDVMLMFMPATSRTRVWVYHLRQNKWEEAPEVYPSPSYHCSDASYDPVNNVSWLIGGWEWGHSGAVTTRETWSYRYKPGATAVSEIPGKAIFAIRDSDGKQTAILSWKAPAKVPGQGYNVYRGEGLKPWTASWTRLTAAPIRETSFSETASLEVGQRYYYRVTAVSKDRESRPSLIARVSPPPVRRMFVSRGVAGQVRLNWIPVSGATGYNIYRAAGSSADLWRKAYKYRDIAKSLKKLNPVPVKAAEFIDKPGDKLGSASESTWAPIQVYVVRAVNALGFESGPGPATLSLPTAPGPVLVARLSDGRRMVLCPREGIAMRGRHLFRMDVYKGDLIFRAAGAPESRSVFFDSQRWPIGHRRQYFVVDVDEAGQLGVPSSPAWDQTP